MIKSSFDFSSLHEPPTANLRLDGNPLRSKDFSVFAAQNGLHFTEKTIYDRRQRPEKSRLFKYGFFPNIRDAVNGTIHNLPFSFFTYRYAWTGSGKSSYHTEYVASIRLPQAWPNVLVRANLTDHHPVHIDSIEFPGQAIQTGNALFDKYFTVFAPVADHQLVTEALLTPAFLDVILQYAPTYDIEIIEDRLYIYASRPYTLKKQWCIELCTALEALTIALQPILQDQQLVVRDNPAGQTTHTLQPNRAAIWRKRGTIIAVVFIAACMLILLGKILGSTRPTTGGFVAAVVIVVGVLVVILTAYSARAIKRQTSQVGTGMAELRARFGEINYEI